MFIVQPSRRHPFQTRPFWMVFGVGALLVAAWKLNWVPVDDVMTAMAPIVFMDSIDAPQQPQPFKPPSLRQPDVVEFSSEAMPMASAAADRDVIEGAGTVQPAGYEIAAPPAVRAAREIEAAPARELNPAEQLSLARELLGEGDDIAAHRAYSTVYWQHPELRDSIQAEIDQLASRIYFGREQHYIPAYQIELGDNLVSIARQYQVSWEYLAKLNQVQPEKIQAGRKLKVLQGPFNVIVDLNRFELTVHAYGYYVRRYPVGIGRDGASPVGTFHVVDKVANPTYYGPDGVISSDDPANPLGEFWLAINDESGSLDGYGIHGTIEPESIGKAASRGCIRLRDADLRELYDLLTVGSEVTIRK